MAERASCLGAGEAVGGSQGGARWADRGVCRTCGKSLKLRGGRIPRHVPARPSAPTAPDGLGATRSELQSVIDTWGHLRRGGVTGDKPSIIGRESFLMEALAKLLLGAANKHHGVSKLRDQHRGYWFEVQVLDDKDEPTGHIARVTVELDRLEQL